MSVDISDKWGGATSSKLHEKCPIFIYRKFYGGTFGGMCNVLNTFNSIKSYCWLFILNPVGVPLIINHLITSSSRWFFLVGHMWDIFCKNRVNLTCVFSQVVRRQVSIATDHFDDSDVLQYLSDDGQWEYSITALQYRTEWLMLVIAECRISALQECENMLPVTG